MSNFDTKDLEMLSAYLDGELSDLEKQHIETKLQQSPTLRQELSALRLTKDRVNAIQPLQQDPYFETRLMQKLVTRHEGVSTFFNNRRPVIALASVTLIFLVVFKLQPNLFHQVLESNKANLEAFYAKNLMPLISATNLTNDDVFNFAFNKYLPINKENNQVISFGKNAKGEQIIEVKNADVAGMPLNLETFAKTYGLSKEQKRGVSKILEKYTDKIAAAVLVNDKNSVAVNASLWGYHDELRKELLGYVSESNSQALKKMFPDGGEDILLAAEHSGEAYERSPASDYYYYISPDTFFASRLPVDRQKIDNTIRNLRYTEAVYKNAGEKDNQQREIMSAQANISNEMKRVKVELHRVAKITSGAVNLAHEVQVFADSGSCRVVIPKGVSGVRSSAKLDNLAAKLDSAFSSFKVYSYAYADDDRAPISIPDFDIKKYGNPLTVRSGSRAPQVTAKPSTDSIARKYNLYFDKSDSFMKNKKQSQSSVIAIDSLQKLLRYYLGDSLAMRDQKSKGNGLEEVRKELEQIRKEIEKIRKEGQLKKPNKDTILEAKNILEL